MKSWHKISWVLIFALAIVSWIIALSYWDKLPQIIPTHFGISGQPDAWSHKSLFYSFLLPFLQIIMSGALIFLYFKPQYSDMPTTLWLMALEEKKRNHAFDLIKTMLAVTALWLAIFFTYLTYQMNASALTGGGPNPFIMIGMIVVMFVWLVFWTIKVYKATKSAMKELKGHES